MIRLRVLFLPQGPAKEVCGVRVGVICELTRAEVGWSGCVTTGGCLNLSQLYT